MQMSIVKRIQVVLFRWADEGGFGFSKAEAACVHFCSRCGSHGSPCLHLNGNGEEVVGDVGFLRLIFVGELSFVPHVGNAGREVCKGPGCY